MEAKGLERKMTDHNQQLINTLQDMSQMMSSSHKKFGVYDNFQDLVLREGQLFAPVKAERNKIW